jgi:hypothetical protein
MLNKREIELIIGKVIEFYPKFQKDFDDNPPGTIRAWHAILEKAPDKETVFKAIKRYAEANKWSPAPSDILKITKAIVGLSWGRESLPQKDRVKAIEYKLREDQCLALVGPLEDSQMRWALEIEQKERCIRHLGVWRRKLDFCFDILGPELVNKIYKDWCKNNWMIPNPNGLAYSVIKKKFPKEAYKKMLSELVDLARTSKSNGNKPKIPNYPLLQARAKGEYIREYNPENYVDGDLIPF